MARREANRRGEGDQLRDDLIAAATRLLVSPQQVAIPSLRAIAREVGVSPSGVYLHFSSQEDLIAAVVERQYDELRRALAASDRTAAEPRARLIAMARAYVDWGTTNPGAYQLLFESGDALPGGAPSVATGDELMDGVTALVRAHTGQQAAAGRATAMRLWTALHGLVSLRIHKPQAAWLASASRDAEMVVRTHVPEARQPGRRTGT